MSFINKENGHIQLSPLVTIKPFAKYDDLLLSLKQETLEYRNEDHYNLFQYINIFKYATQYKSFHFELYFDKGILKNISFDFTCEAGFEISYEQWLADVFGQQNHFNWGTITVAEHPKFCVPLFSIKFTSASE